jgi:ankyrin repeat protein
MHENWFSAIRDGDLVTARTLLAEEPSLIRLTTETGLSAILLALYYGEAKMAAGLYAQGAPLSIFEASALGSTADLERFLQADIMLANAVNGDGFTPLGLACFFGQPAAVRVLLGFGAEPNQRASNPTRVTPLHSACAAKDPRAALESAQTLLQNGAQVDEQQQGGFTALHAAAQNGSLPLVQLLLEYGANPDVRNDEGLSAMDFAHRRGHIEVVRALEQAING